MCPKHWQQQDVGNTEQGWGEFCTRISNALILLYGSEDESFSLCAWYKMDQLQENASFPSLSFFPPACCYLDNQLEERIMCGVWLGAALIWRGQPEGKEENQGIRLYNDKVSQAFISMGVGGGFTLVIITVGKFDEFSAWTCPCPSLFFPL